MAKVYCADCIFFESGERVPTPMGPPDYIKERCTASENNKDTHKEPDAMKLSSPRIINRFNNCPWYQSRETSSSSDSTMLESSSSTEIQTSSSS